MQNGYVFQPPDYEETVEFLEKAADNKITGITERHFDWIGRYAKPNAWGDLAT
jgi:hypothetical protein